MASYNKVILVGNLTRDVELKYTAKGTAIARISLAMNRKWKTEAGEEKEEVTFAECDAFGRTAEVIGQYLSKGKPILVEGRLKLDTWQDKNTNQTRNRLGVVIESFQFLGSKGAGSSSASKPDRAPAKEADLEEDDVPF